MKNKLHITIHFYCRLSTLEAACSERQDVISIMSRCEDWVKRMKDRTTGLKPTTADIGKIRHLIEEYKVHRLLQCNRFMFFAGV